MERTISVLQTDSGKIILTDGDREILQVNDITVHTVHCQNGCFHNFERIACSEDSDALFSVRGNEVDVKLRIHQENGVAAFEFSGKVKGRENKEGYPLSFTQEHALEASLTIKGKEPFLANYQHKTWWLRPEFGSDLSEVPEKSQIIIRKREDIFEVFLAVCGNQFRSDLSGTAEGIHLALSSFCANRREIQGCALVYGSGTNPYQLIRSMIRLAKNMQDRVFLEQPEIRYPEVFKSMGWCTWDSLGQNVSELAIIQKMEEFRKKDIYIPWVLIDDGWSDVDRENLKLRGLDADPERFPNGLSGTVKILKETYHVAYVGVWQAWKGYWYGIEAGSDAHHAFAPFLTRYGSGELSIMPTETASFGFWNRWHSELRKKGIDFVKIDGQGSVPTMLSGDTREETAIGNLYSGMEASVFLNFDGNLINCMGMAPENVWNREKSTISRSSDDYTPTITGSILEHTLQNCYNNVYQGDLFVGDWDMFWTSHEETHYSSVLRVISGGPIYISDGLGKTRKEVLDRLMRTDGTLLKCDAVARPSLDCLTKNVLANGKILKIYNTCKNSVFIACFTWDITGEETNGNIIKKDIPVMNPGRYLVYDYEQQSVGICDDSIPYDFSMSSRQAKLLELIPEEKDITVLGMVNKYIAIAGVDYIQKFQDTCIVDVNCSGTFALFSEREIKAIYLNEEETEYRKEKGIYLIQVPYEKSTVTIKF